MTNEELREAAFQQRRARIAVLERMKRRFVIAANKARWKEPSLWRGLVQAEIMTADELHHEELRLKRETKSAPSSAKGGGR